MSDPYVNGLRDDPSEAGIDLADTAFTMLQRHDPGQGYWSHHEMAMHCALRGIGLALLAVHAELRATGQTEPLSGWTEITRPSDHAAGIRTFKRTDQETATP